MTEAVNHPGSAHAPQLLAPPAEVLASLNQDGKRRWMYPRLVSGAWLHRRRVVAWTLILLFNVLPFVRINGAPAVLLDLATREFHLFGLTLLPTDVILLALLLIGWILVVFLTTALFGRIWCGWACPQTVYLEFVFRPIERLCFGRSGTGGKPVKSSLWRHALQKGLYMVAAFWLANVFLSYFVGVDRLFGLRGEMAWITASPFDHPGAFFAFFLTMGGILFDFGYFRDQMCTLTCPYGRFQSVMLDRNSYVITYDSRRGEPRGKSKKVSLKVLAPVSETKAKGDCVDCGLCVAVCPNGIDIRSGLQMECLHCTACMDACDSVMKKFNRPTGLIRYATQANAEPWHKRWLRPRVALYTLALLAVSLFWAVQVAGRQAADLQVNRARGTTFLITADDQVENLFDIEIAARHNRPQSLRLHLETPPGTQAILEGGSADFVLEPHARAKRTLRVRCPRTEVNHALVLNLVDNGQIIESHRLPLLGPYIPPTSASSNPGNP